jgi:hypothetical protein
MKSSSLKLLLTTLLLTSGVIFFKISHNPENLQLGFRRNLEVKPLTRETYNADCVLTNITLGYAEKFVNTADTVSEYINKIPGLEVSDENVKILTDIILVPSKPFNAQEVIKMVIPQIVFIILAVLTLFAWLTYCGCCCRPCGCCKSTSKEEGMCSMKGISCIIMFVSLVGLVAICVIGFIFSSKLPKKVDEIECATMQFYLDTKFGEIKDTSPKWIGTEGIVAKLDQFIAAFDEVERNKDGAFSDTSSISNHKSSYMALLDAKWEENKGVTTVPADPKKSGSITPGYITSWGPKSEQITTLGRLELEYNIMISGGVDLLNELKKAIDNINFSEQKSAFTDAKNQVEPMNESFEKFDTDYISKFRDNVN